MKVKEAMTKNVKSVLPEMSVKDAMGVLLGLEIGTVPVIDKNGKLIGMFTERDILANILPEYVASVGKFVYLENPKSVKNKVANLEKLKVENVINKKFLVTIDEDATLCEAAHVMLTQGIKRIPVLNRAGKVAGIIVRSDVLKKLTEGQA